MPANCGIAGNESCCLSNLVEGGTYKRSYDGANFTDLKYPATVSDFRLDRFEVTVGRFRQFVNAVLQGTGLPTSGAGKHTHLSGGGLNAGAELGWDPTWNDAFPPNQTAWDTQLDCQSTLQTWKPAGGGSDNLPINCITWYEAYAFCIWDGGFLPSEAEWNYAAAHGMEQRVYPWQSGMLNASYASYDCMGDGSGPQSCDFPDILKVGSKPMGDGYWGQADLAGNIYEWNLDWYTDPCSNPCYDCAYLETPSPLWRIMRGGSWNHDWTRALTAYRDSMAPSDRHHTVGARCARSP